jgi:hypothetical protein
MKPRPPIGALSPFPFVLHTDRKGIGDETSDRLGEYWGSTEGPP